MMSKSLRTIASVGICCAGMSCAATAAAQASTELIAPKKSGFALQTSVSASTPMFDDKLLFFSLGSLTGGMTFGYKFDRFIIGVGFDFARFTATRTQQQIDPMTGQSLGTEERTEGTYSFVVYPDLQVALARSADQRAELIGQFSIGAGSWGDIDSLDTTPDNNSRIRVNWRVGPGVRYWVHPQIGFSLATGIKGDHMIFGSSTSSDDETLSMSSIYAQMGLVGVF